MRIGILFFLFLFLGFGLTTSFSQDKIIEKSGKTPSWINSTEKDFIIEMGTGPTIEQARDKALLNVKESIVKSVAEKITSSSQEKTTENREGNTFEIRSDYQSTVYTKTADLPFIKGISLNKVSEYYWEKRKKKGTESVIVCYYLKYPFSNLSLQNIILDYELDQRRILEEYELIIEGIDEINTVELLLEKIQTIRGIVPQLDEKGKGNASLHMQKLDGIVKSLAIEEVTNRKGELTYFLSYGDRHFKTALQPKISSNCASNFRHIQDGNAFTIIYDYSDCFEVVSNFISVEYRFGNYKVTRSFPLVLTE